MPTTLGTISGYEDCNAITVYRDRENLQLYIETKEDTISLTPMMVDELLDILKDEFES